MLTPYRRPIFGRRSPRQRRQYSTPKHSVKRIGELYRIEAELRGLDPETRLNGRQERSARLVADIQTWLVHHRARVATKSPLGEALAYIAKYWDGLKLFLTDGRVEIDNDSVERTIRPIALNRKNALFSGHDAGAENWATIASLIETCKLNALPSSRVQSTRRPTSPPAKGRITRSRIIRVLC